MPAAHSVCSACVLRPLSHADLDDVMELEQATYEFAWTRGNFMDSLLAGYWTQSLWGPGPNEVDPSPGHGAAASNILSLRAYGWACLGAGEVHLLNLTVATWAQGQGHARLLLDQLVALGRRQGAEALLLEVRPSNLRAIALYERYGMRLIGHRPGYYPASHGQREDALIMSMSLL